MRILLYSLNYSPEPVGIGKYSGELASWLAGQGHEVKVICSPPYFPHWRVGLNAQACDSQYRNSYNVEFLDGVTVIRCPLWVPTCPSGFKRLLHLASFACSSFFPLFRQLRWRPHVIITVVPALFCAPSTLLFRHFCGPETKAWLHYQDLELDAAFELGMLRGKHLRLLAERCESSLIRNFNIVSSISQAMVFRLQEKGLATWRSHLLPNWVDLDKIYPQSCHEHAQNIYRRTFNIDPKTTVLMYSGSMNRKQGLELLVTVIRRLKHRRDLLWLLAGEGPTKIDLLNACQGMKNVQVLPLQPLEHLNDWLNIADVHLLPQKRAAADLVLPSKLLGILASGRPVIACSPLGSELGYLASEAGSCVPPDDVDAFASAIESFANDPQLRIRKGAQARRFAEQNFGRESVLKEFQRKLLPLSL